MTRYRLTVAAVLLVAAAAGFGAGAVWAIWTDPPGDLGHVPVR